MKSTKSGASAVDAGSLFQRGIVLGKKLFLKQLREVEICLNFSEWFDLVFAIAGTRYRYKFVNVYFVVDYLVEHCQL